MMLASNSTAQTLRPLVPTQGQTEAKTSISKRGWSDGSAAKSTGFQRNQV